MLLPAIATPHAAMRFTLSSPPFDYAFSFQSAILSAAACR